MYIPRNEAERGMTNLEMAYKQEEDVACCFAARKKEETSLNGKRKQEV